MSNRSSRCVALFIGAATCLAARTSSAGDDRVPKFDVTFSAPMGCAEPRGFAEQVLYRTSRAIQSSDAPDFRFKLTVSDAGEGPRGELEIIDAQRTATIRQVPGEDCASIVQAAALIAALVLDPTGAVNVSPPPGSDARASDANSVPQRTRATRPSAPKARVDLPAPADAGNETRVPPARPSGWRFGVGAAPTAHGAIAPGMTPGFSLGVRLAEKTPSVVAQIVGIDAELAASSPEHTRLGSASFTWFAARTWSCPLRWPEAPSPFGMRPCVFFDAGVLRGVGDDTTDERSQTTPWFAAGGLGRLEWTATERVSFELQAGAVVPFFHDRFVFLPDVVAHQIPPVAFAASAGTSIWFR
jgi:hypothetical protein